MLQDIYNHIAQDPFKITLIVMIGIWFICMVFLAYTEEDY
jgi:hypothetical protein